MHRFYKQLFVSSISMYTQSSISKSQFLLNFLITYSIREASEFIKSDFLPFLYSSFFLARFILISVHTLQDLDQYLCIIFITNLSLHLKETCILQVLVH